MPKFTSKRVHQKNGYYVITYDESGNKLGKSKWHGSKDKAEYKTISRYQAREARTILTKDELRTGGFAVPDKIEKSLHNYNWPYEYVVRFQVTPSEGAKPEWRYITVTNRNAMTRQQIKEALMEISKFETQSAKFINLLNFRVRTLYIGGTYGNA